MKYLIAFALFLCAMTSHSQSSELRTVPYVDLNRYLGKWYDIASFPQRFQKGCACTSAEYSMNSNGTIKVRNRCMKDGKEKISEGRAKVKDKKTNARLSVTFFWPFKGKYWIIDLADDYSYAVVGHPSRDYLWILSRTKTMDDKVYQGILERLRQQGYDLSRLKTTEQNCGGG